MQLYLNPEAVCDKKTAQGETLQTEASLGCTSNTMDTEHNKLPTFLTFLLHHGTHRRMYECVRTGAGTNRSRSRQHRARAEGTATAASSGVFPALKGNSGHSGRPLPPTPLLRAALTATRWGPRREQNLSLRSPSPTPNPYSSHNHHLSPQPARRGRGLPGKGGNFRLQPAPPLTLACESALSQ